MTDSGYWLSADDHAAIVGALERWRDVAADMREIFRDDRGAGRAALGADFAIADAERALALLRGAEKVDRRRRTTRFGKRGE
jgi:hypothetical protein